MSLGFIDYVFDYFRGPAGADGATGPVGPAGPGDIHRLAGQTFFETAGSVVHAGDHTVSFIIPDGSFLVSAYAELTDGDGADFALPAGSSVSVNQVSSTHFTITVTLGADLPGTPEVVGNTAIFYYQPV